MAARPPLVIGADGLSQQLQSGDSLPSLPTPVQIITPVLAGTYTLDGSPIALLVPLAAIGSCTLNLPASPFDTQIIRVSTQYTITTLTVSAGTGKTINGAPTTITPSTPFGVIYRAATTTWFRI